jgi:Tfp pilus assembly protein PilF
MERMEKLKEFLLADPQDAFVKHALALEYSKRGEEANARTLYEEILERDPAYIGSYYQLCKLLERTGETELAIRWYEKGMSAAKIAGDKRAYSELRSAFEELSDPA